MPSIEPCSSTGTRSPKRASIAASVSTSISVIVAPTAFASGRSASRISSQRWQYARTRSVRWTESFLNQNPGRFSASLRRLFSRAVACRPRAPHSSSLPVAELQCRIERIVAATYLQRDRRALVELREDVVHLRSGLRLGGHALLDDRQDHVARLPVAAHDADAVLDQHTARLQVEFLALLVGQVGQHEPHPVGLRLLLRRGGAAPWLRRRDILLH